MTAIDRLTAIIAEHYGTATPNGRWVCNACGAALVEVGATARHVAEVIAAADGLAVVDVPKADEHDTEGTRWVLTPGFGVQALAEGGIEFDLPIVGTAADALRLAGMAVAAARADVAGGAA